MFLNNTNTVIFFTTGFFATFVFLYLLCRFRDKKEAQWKQVAKIATATDLLVLEDVASKLSVESKWNKNDDRFCFPEEKLSLFCAVAFASQKHFGKYDHETVAVHELRMTIDDKYPERWNDHPLMDFNNHADTNHHDVINVVLETLDRLKAMLKL